MKTKLLTVFSAFVVAVGIMIMAPMIANAHCDTMDGPVIMDAQIAIEENNIKYISKWVMPEDEAELVEIFNEVMKVRNHSPEAQKLADKYLFENLVRIHRAGEGAPYTGIKPEGTPIADEVVAADKSIAAGNLEPFHGVLGEEKIAELEESFKRVLSVRDFEVDDVDAGREYVEAYVTFTHLAEGEYGHGTEGEHGHEVEESHGVAETHDLEESSLNWIPWTLAGVFLGTTILAHFKHIKSSK